ncbi:MAG: hypothetical protein JSS75_02800 [Bacteroidetes bacterium]|nr:hypothetical protein [Bacteroidota bacterium]
MKKIYLLLVVLVAMPLVSRAQTWQYTGNMNSVHWLAEMVALDDQTALIVGGFDDQFQALSTTELYDPSTGTWARSGNLNVARAYPKLVKLSNGHVLSTGGAVDGNGSVTDVVEDYDPTTMTWTVVGHLLNGRMVATATLLQDGRILIAGGLTSSGTTASCELYDPVSNTSVMAGSMHQNRYEHQAVLMNDGRVLVTGGRDGGSGSNYFNECEVYDPSTNSWTVITSMFQARMEAIMACFSDNTVLAAAGRNSPSSSAPGSEILDPSTMLWQPTAPVHEPVCWAGSIQFPDDRFMITGGIASSAWQDLYGLDDITSAQCEWYDRSLQQWNFAPQLNLSRCRHCAVYLHPTHVDGVPSEVLLVAGGQMGSATQDSSGVHTYTPGFTNTSEILDVTPAALKAYMKMPINAAVGPDRNVALSFNATYAADGSIVAQYVSDGTPVTLEVMSVDGKTAKQIEGAPSAAGLNSFVIPTSDLSNGTYFIRYVNGSQRSIFKFFVSK